MVVCPDRDTTRDQDGFIGRTGFCRIAPMKAWAVTVLVGIAAILTAVAAFELTVDRRIGFADTIPAAPDRAMHEPSEPGEIMILKARTFGNAGKLVSKTTVYVSDQFGGRAAAARVAYDRPRTIALIGDSFTYGAENEYADTLQGILERALPQANVLNFSRSGTSSIYFAATAGAFLQHVRLPLDAAVVGIYTDMQIGDIPRVLAAQKSWGRYVVHGADVGAERYRQILASTIRRTWFVAEVVLRGHSSTFNTLVRYRPANDFAVSLRNDLDQDRFAEWRTLLLKHLDAMCAELKLPPEKVLVWLIASNHDLNMKKANAGADYRARSDRFWNEASMAMRKQGYVVVDPRPDVDRSYLVDNVYPFTPSGHFAPAGYRISTAAIIPALTPLLK